MAAGERTVTVEPGTIVVYSDIGCPWAHLCVFRLHRAREELGLTERVSFDMRAFPLEVINERPTPKRILDREIPVVGALDPDAGWKMWDRPDHEYPVTTLPAIEAVEAAKEQSLAASEALDRALRYAFFGQSRTISMRHVILSVAGEVEGLDRGKLEDALDSGIARSRLMEHAKESRGDRIDGSPHVFLPDGSDVHNPGVEFEWRGERGEKVPVVTSDDPSVYGDILRRA